MERNLDNQEQRGSARGMPEYGLEVAKILEAAKKGLVIHGEKFFKDGQESVLPKPDLDGRAALFILELAGMDYYPQLTFVKKGGSEPGKINIDTGERPSFVIEDDGGVFFDHHGEEKDIKSESTSAAKIVYDKMIEFGLLKREEWLNNLVQFVTDTDNESYSTVDEDGENIFKNGKWAKSLYGLARILQFETIVKCMKQGRNPAYPFSEKELDELIVEVIVEKDDDKKKLEKVERSLADLCKKQQKEVNSSIEGMNLAQEKMERAGIRSHTKNLGQVLFNSISEFDSKGKQYFMKDKLPIGFTLVRAFVDSYVKWFGDGFFITSKFHLGETFEKIKEKFPEAKLIRGTMIVCPGKKDNGAAPSKDKLLKLLGVLEMVN